MILSFEKCVNCQIVLRFFGQQVPHHHNDDHFLLSNRKNHFENANFIFLKIKKKVYSSLFIFLSLFRFEKRRKKKKIKKEKRTKRIKIQKRIEIKQKKEVFFFLFLLLSNLIIFQKYKKKIQNNTKNRYKIIQKKIEIYSEKRNNFKMSKRSKNNDGSKHEKNQNEQGQNVIQVETEKSETEKGNPPIPTQNSSNSTTGSNTKTSKKPNSNTTKNSKQKPPSNQTRNKSKKDTKKEKERKEREMRLKRIDAERKKKEEAARINLEKKKQQLMENRKEKEKEIRDKLAQRAREIKERQKREFEMKQNRSKLNNTQNDSNSISESATKKDEKTESQNKNDTKRGRSRIRNPIKNAISTPIVERGPSTVPLPATPENIENPSILPQENDDNNMNYSKQFCYKRDHSEMDQIQDPNKMDEDEQEEINKKQKVDEIHVPSPPNFTFSSSEKDRNQSNNQSNKPRDDTNDDLLSPNQLKRKSMYKIPRFNQSYHKNHSKVIGQFHTLFSICQCKEGQIYSAHDGIPYKLLKYIEQENKKQKRGPLLYERRNVKLTDFIFAAKRNFEINNPLNNYHYFYNSGDVFIQITETMVKHPETGHTERYAHRALMGNGEVSLLCDFKRSAADHRNRITKNDILKVQKWALKPTYFDGKWITVFVIAAFRAIIECDEILATDKSYDFHKIIFVNPDIRIIISNSRSLLKTCAEEVREDHRLKKRIDGILNNEEESEHKSEHNTPPPPKYNAKYYTTTDESDNSKSNNNTPNSNDMPQLNNNNNNASNDNNNNNSNNNNNNNTDLNVDKFTFDLSKVSNDNDNVNTNQNETSQLINISNIPGLPQRKRTINKNLEKKNELIKIIEPDATEEAIRDYQACSISMLQTMANSIIDAQKAEEKANSEEKLLKEKELNERSAILTDLGVTDQTERDYFMTAPNKMLQKLIDIKTKQNAANARMQQILKEKQKKEKEMTSLRKNANSLRNKNSEENSDEDQVMYDQHEINQQQHQASIQGVSTSPLYSRESSALAQNYGSQSLSSIKSDPSKKVKKELSIDLDAIKRISKSDNTQVIIQLPEFPWSNRNILPHNDMRWGTVYREKTKTSINFHPIITKQCGYLKTPSGKLLNYAHGDLGNIIKLINDKEEVQYISELTKILDPCDDDYGFYSQTYQNGLILNPHRIVRILATEEYKDDYAYYQVGKPPIPVTRIPKLNEYIPFLDSIFGTEMTLFPQLLSIPDGNSRNVIYGHKITPFLCENSSTIIFDYTDNDQLLINSTCYKLNRESPHFGDRYLLKDTQLEKDTMITTNGNPHYIAINGDKENCIFKAGLNLHKESYSRSLTFGGKGLPLKLQEKICIKMKESKNKRAQQNKINQKQRYLSKEEQLTNRLKLNQGYRSKYSRGRGRPSPRGGRNYGRGRGGRNTPTGKGRNYNNENTENDKNDDKSQYY